jgi:hypothetical protein
MAGLNILASFSFFRVSIRLTVSSSDLRISRRIDLNLMTYETLLLTCDIVFNVLISTGQIQAGAF